MKVASLALFLLVAACLGGCVSTEERHFSGRVHMLPGERTALVEQPGGSLVAVSLVNGAVQWRYEPARAPCPYFNFAVRHRLVCPVVETPAGDLVLRYDSELHVISRIDGRLRWKMSVHRFASGKLRCPAATADSGVLLLRRHGLVLQKFDSNGTPAWRYSLLSLSSAVSPPRVALDSGDVLLETNSHLVAISPGGSLNWALPRTALVPSETR